MTRDEATNLVTALIAACVQYETCDDEDEEEALKEFQQKTVVVIDALTGHTTSAETLEQISKLDLPSSPVESEFRESEDGKSVELVIRARTTKT